MATLLELSARVGQRSVNGGFMKKASSRKIDDMRPEYDFATMRGGVRGKYAKRFREGTNIVLLDDDVAIAFPNETAVNEALRTILRAATHLRQSKKGSPNKALQRSGQTTVHR